MKRALRLLAFVALAMPLAGCITGAAGLAIAGASALVNAMSGSSGGAAPQGLAIDPNRALSERLATAEHSVNPSCQATLDRLKAASRPQAGDASTPGAQSPAPAPDPAGSVAEGVATAGGGGPEGVPARGPAHDGAGGCALRLVCLGGARAPVQMMVCDRSTVRAAALDLPAPAPLAGGSAFGGGPGARAPEAPGAPPAAAATVSPPPPGPAGWTWGDTPKD